MNLLKSIFGRLTNLGYDAVVPGNKRKPPTGLLRSEDLELMSEDRRKLVSSTRDLSRNFTIAGWMIRKHLDYITTFSFQPKTGNDGLDAKLERLIADRGKPENCDVGGRFGIKQMLRIAEARRCIDHDVFLMRIANGTLQPIEGDRVRSPVGDQDNMWQPQVGTGGQRLVEWVQGVQIDMAGKPLNYAVFRRGNSANLFVLDRIVAAKNVYHHAIFERFDQVRGVSPLAAALNTLRDVYEGFNFALAKMKVTQLFGLSVFRDSPESFGTESLDVTQQSSSDSYEEGDSSPSTAYKVDFNQGPFVIDMADGDRAEILESKTPSLEFQSFCQVMIAAALKALDIPYSFYAENFTNYSGSRGAWLQYNASAEVKRADSLRLLAWWTDWQIQIAIEDGYFTAEEAAALAEPAESYKWLNRGLPWLDPLKEIQAELRACDAAFDNPEDVAQSHGKNVYENIDAIARVNKYAAKQGVVLNTMPPLPTTPTRRDPSIDGDQRPDDGTDDEEDPEEDDQP